YWYTIIEAKRINSNAMKADAWHHRSDAFSSIGSLVGVIGFYLGYYILDAIASILICGFILKVAIEIFNDAID
ncbi:cation transporter, partial [Desulfovibrio desulfuricans]|nr:cation transporter [Desulfovibrio desulfuricans]